MKKSFYVFYDKMNEEFMSPWQCKNDKVAVKSAVLSIDAMKSKDKNFDPTEYDLYHFFDIDVEDSKPLVNSIKLNLYKIEVNYEVENS